MHARSDVRTGLVGARALQLVFELLMVVWSSIWIAQASKAHRVWREESIGTDLYSVTISCSDAVDALVNASVALLISMVSLALSATWLGLTLAPAARSRANCLARYTCDVSWDIVGSVVWLTLFIELVVFYKHDAARVPMIAFSAILVVLFIAAAAMSGLQRQRVIREEQQVQLVGTCGASTVTVVHQAPYGVAMNGNKHHF